MVDPLAVGLGAAVAGALVNQLFNAWRESRAGKRDELVKDFGEIRSDIRAIREDVSDIREKQAGIAAVVDALVIAPRDDRPKRMR